MKDRENGTKETSLTEEKEAEVAAVAAVSILPSSSRYAMPNNSSFTPMTRLSRQTHHRPPGAFAMRPGASGSGVAAASGNSSGNTSSSTLSSFFHGLRPSNSARGARNRAATRTTFDDESSSSSFSVGSHVENHDVHIVPVAQLVSPHGVIAAYDVEIAQEVYHGVSVPHPHANGEAVAPAPEPDGIFWTAPHDGMKASATATALSKRSHRRRHTNAGRQDDNGTGGGWFSVRCIAYLALVLGLILAAAVGLQRILVDGGNNRSTATTTTAPAKSSSTMYPVYDGYWREKKKNKTSTADNRSGDNDENVTSAGSSNSTLTNAEPMTTEPELLPAFSNSTIGTGSTNSSVADANTTISPMPTTAPNNATNATTTAAASNSPNATQPLNDKTAPTAAPSISPSLPTEDIGENTNLDEPPDDLSLHDSDGPGDKNNEPNGDNFNGNDNSGNGNPNDQQGPTDNGNQKDKRNG